MPLLKGEGRCVCGEETRCLGSPSVGVVVIAPAWKFRGPRWLSSLSNSLSLRVSLSKMLIIPVPLRELVTMSHVYQAQHLGLRESPAVIIN